MNSVNITARLTREPELADTRGDTAVCNLRVAVERRGEGAVFLDVKTFNAQAVACAQHLSKGDPIAVIGRLELDEWEAQGGGKRSRLYVIGERIEFLGRMARQAAPQPAAAPAQPQAEEVVPAQVA
jgi:single-strand DNA-binding protein